MINVNTRLLLQVFKWIQEHSHYQCKVCDFSIFKIDNLKLQFRYMQALYKNSTVYFSPLVITTTIY